jgi:hypothetical protein
MRVSFTDWKHRRPPHPRHSQRIASLEVQALPGRASQHRRPFSVTPDGFGPCEVSAGVDLRRLAPDAHDQAIGADLRLQSHGAHVILGDAHRGVEAGGLVGKNLDSDVGSGMGSHMRGKVPGHTKITANRA